MASSVVDLGEGAAAIRPSDRLGIPLGPGHPGGLLHALGERDDWVDLDVYGALLTDLYVLFTNPGVRFLSGFFGPIERGFRDAGHRIEFVPADFRRFAPILAGIKPRVMATIAAPPDEDGWMSLSLHAGATIDELHRAGADPDRLLIVETSPKFPRTMGWGAEHPHRIHMDEADLVLASEYAPVDLAETPGGEVERAIAELASHYVHDGCTLQTGIGSIPSAIASMLAEGPNGDFGVHSEMFTTGLMHLHQAGKVSNARKGIFDGVSVTTFAAGDPELYTWLDGNDEVRFLPVSVVNDPDVIARNHDIVTINGAIAVDLYGQLVADTVAGRQFSGIGGHEDFLAGPGLELSDRSIVCLPATATVNGEVVSRITAQFAAGSIVTTPRHQVDLVITEFGVAELQGRTVSERAMALASVADPRFRDELTAAARLVG